jgi:hypothetical protein
LAVWAEAQPAIRTIIAIVTHREKLIVWHYKTQMTWTKNIWASFDLYFFTIKVFEVESSISI